MNAKDEFEAVILAEASEVWKQPGHQDSIKIMVHDAMKGREKDGRYWTRTSDPCGVNTVLYRLS